MAINFDVNLLDTAAQKADLLGKIYAKAFVEKVEKAIKIPVTLIGTGPDTLEMVDRRKLL